jgi:alkylation response protein AidB-like acyl-CoA dehydrogenase
MTLRQRLRELEARGALSLPTPGCGRTTERHRSLLEIGREDLSLARLAEAHVDALAILSESGGHHRVPGVLYGVWASESKQHQLTLRCSDGKWLLSGSKMFCSGAGLIDRALVTVRTPESRLLDVNLSGKEDAITIDYTDWKASAFAETQTATVSFNNIVVAEEDFICEPDWYLTRPGFWHGACGPAACWAGGAIGLVDYALSHGRDDAHGLAHLGGMSADEWALRAFLDSAGEEIDDYPNDAKAACIRALRVRHLVVQACNDVLNRLPRAFGPRPLAYDADISRRCQELALYITQSHAERDLESLGRQVLGR